jgi:hypothetical protein
MTWDLERSTSSTACFWLSASEGLFGAEPGESLGGVDLSQRGLNKR